MRVTFKVLDSLSTAPRPAADQDPQGPARMPPASRGPPPLGDPDRMVAVARARLARGAGGVMISHDPPVPTPSFLGTVGPTPHVSAVRRRLKFESFREGEH